MMRWIILTFVILFVVAQITRLRPSKRDKQLQSLRKAASHAGFIVRFWTVRNSGYSYRELPESAFIYLLPWQPKTTHTSEVWALWVNANGEMVNIAGQPPDLAQQWLISFRERFPDAWALLECNATGMGLLWQERGDANDIQSIADALDLLRKNLNALSH